MGVSGIGSGGGYNFSQVSRDNTAQDKEITELKLKIGQRQDTGFVEREREEEQKKAQAAKEKKQADKSDAVQKSLDSTYEKLSDKAKEYLKKLQEKYSNMDFFIADVDSDSQAQRIMASGSKEFSVLMDSATLEQMAQNETVAERYEALIGDSAEQLTQMKNQFAEQGLNVKAVGMEIDADGNTTYYSIIDDSLSYYEKEMEKQQKKKEERIEEEKQEQRKEELQKQRIEDIEKQREQHKEAMEKQLNGRYTMVSAGTIEELKNRLQQEQDKVLRLRNSMIPTGTGVDYTV